MSMSKRPFRSRPKLRYVSGGLLLILAIGLCVHWLVRGNCAKRAETVAYASAFAPDGKLEYAPGIEYEVYLEATRRSLRTVLDRTMKEIRATPLAEKFRIPGEYRFDYDGIAKPADKDLERWKSETPLVRKMPYPYFSAYTIPSDCCGSTVPELFYTESSLSREHGLDIPSSYFVHSDTPSDDAAASIRPSFFCGDSPRPPRIDYAVETEKIDRLMLMLTYYYRGWMDHLHAWSNGGLYGWSLFQPREVVPGEKGQQRVSLPSLPFPFGPALHGLGFRLTADDAIRSFSIRVFDGKGRGHQLVWKAEPDGDAATVWDASNRTLEKLRAEEFYYPFSEPVTEIKSATVQVTGEPGAKLRVDCIRPFSITRQHVKRHIQWMNQHNIRPIVWTYHGGRSSWLSLLEFLPASLSLRGREEVVQRPALAGKPGTPAYCADLVKKLGVIFLNATTHPVAKEEDLEAVACSMPSLLELGDGSKTYFFRRWAFHEDSTVGLPEGLVFPPVTRTPQWEGNLGQEVLKFIYNTGRYGARQHQYVHFNLFSATAFSDASPGVVTRSQVKRFHPWTEKSLNILTNLKYNLDGKRLYWQRLWTCPISVVARHTQGMRNLPSHARLDGNAVRVTSWTDEVTGKRFPAEKWDTQDLHGQTFYVPDAETARLFVDNREITALKRNGPDFTGRQSVTVVDTHTPTLVFDEVDFFERNGRVLREGASYYFQRRHAYVGEYSMEVQLEQDGNGKVAWRPYSLDNHETDFVRFSYRKTNPKSRIVLGWSSTPAGKVDFVATEGELEGKQGWKLPHFDDTEYHEVVLDFADMQSPATGEKRIPRGPVREIAFGLRDGVCGDSAFFDRVEFLSIRGVRPHGEDNGLAIGGRIYPPEDGVQVTMRIADAERTTRTSRGGWYVFTGVPRDSILEIRCVRGEVPYYAARGRLVQADRNDLEYHVYCTDPISNSIPRSLDSLEKKVPAKFARRSIGAGQELRDEFSSRFKPHSLCFYAGHVGWDSQYVSELQNNNYGFPDKDRRFENTDDSLRIAFLGECLTEGCQTPVAYHYTTVLESLLRRKLGRNVEIITHATSNSSIGTNAPVHEKYGRQFRPDLVVLLSNMEATATMNGDLQAKTTGWVKEHAPYRMYDFDENGKLVHYPPDPQYGAFMQKPMPVPNGAVPWVQKLAADGKLEPIAQKAYDLLEAVLTQVYVGDDRKYGARTVVVFGYVPTYWFDARFGDRHASSENYYRRMDAICKRCGATPVNLRPALEGKYSDVRRILCWEQDMHLSPTGHYVMAHALAEALTPIVRQVAGDRANPRIVKKRGEPAAVR